MSKRAVLYLRVSSDEQTWETAGLPEQADVCYQYAMRQGYVLVGDWYFDLVSGLRITKDDTGWRFTDTRKAERAGAKTENITPIRGYVDDYTGKRVNRPAMDALRDLVERGGLDALVTRDTQRFARKRNVAGYLKDWFRRFGVEIDYATQDFADNAAGQAQEGMHEVFDEWQAEELREKAIRGQRRAARMGRIVLSQPSYGYKKVGKGKDVRLEIDEETAKIIRLIFGWYAHGDENGKVLPLKGVAKRLTAMRVPTPADRLGRQKKKAGYGEWGPGSIRAILRNPVYIGRWAYGKRRRVRERIKRTPDGRRAIVEVYSYDPVPRDEWITVEVPSIVSEELFNAAQRRLQENKQRARRNCRRQYLLRGMLTCGECGGKMVGTPAPQGDYAYYRCNGKQWERSNAGRNRCPSKLLRQDWADTAVWQEIRERLLNLDNLIAGLKQRQAEVEQTLVPLRDELEWTERELARYQARIERALDLYLDSDYPKEWLDERLAGERQAQAELEKARQNLMGRIEAGRIDDSDIETVEIFREKAANGLEVADAHFEYKRQILETLRVQGTVKMIDGQQSIAGSWLIPEDELIVNVVNPTARIAAL